MKKIKGKKKTIIVIIVILSTLMIGYALLSRQFSLTAFTRLLPSNWDIQFENLEVSEESSNTPIGATPIIHTSTTSIEFSVTLEKPGDFYEFDVDMANKGNVSAMIDKVEKQIDLTEAEQRVIGFEAFYSADKSEIKKYDLLEPSDFKTITVRVFYKDDINESDLNTISSANTTKNILFKIDFVPANASAVKRLNMKAGAKMLVEKANPISVTDYMSGNTSEMYTFIQPSTDQLRKVKDYRYIGETHCSYDNGAYWIPQREGGTCANIYKKTESSNVTYVESCTESSGVTCQELTGTLKELKNYITYNNETWRVIGVFDGKIKIISDEPIGVMPMDRKSGVGSSRSQRSTNDWTDMQLMYFLNQGEYGKETYTRIGDDIYDEANYIIYKVGKEPASAYYNSYYGYSNALTVDNNWKLNETAQNQAMVSKFYLGASSRTSSYTATEMYVDERSNIHPGSLKERPISWEGKVGLMYISDFGLTYSYNVDTNCVTNLRNCPATNPKKSWLYRNTGDYKNQWTMSMSTDDNCYFVVYIGVTDRTSASMDAEIRPVVYLKPETVLTGEGTKTNPYIIQS